jgi:hypothetical protein
VQEKAATLGIRAQESAVVRLHSRVRIPLHFIGDVAQLEEQLLCTQSVAGSMPVVSTKTRKIGRVVKATAC